MNSGQCLRSCNHHRPDAEENPLVPDCLEHSYRLATGVSQDGAAPWRGDTRRGEQVEQGLICRL